MNRENWVSWAAGFIQGDGTLRLGYFREKRHKHGGIQIRPVIEVVNTEVEPLERLRQLFGGWLCINHHKGVDSRGIVNTKDVHEWGVAYRKALNVAKQIYPYLFGKKRERCRQIIEHYENRA